jgi:tRNA A58 N-methylase Trm61
LLRIRDYWEASMKSYLKHQTQAESYIPFLNAVEQINAIIKERGYLWRSLDEMEKNAHLLLKRQIFEQ